MSGSRTREEETEWVMIQVWADLGITSAAWQCGGLRKFIGRRKGPKSAHTWIQAIAVASQSTTRPWAPFFPLHQRLRM